MIQRSDSLTTTLANHPELQNASKMLSLMESNANLN